MFDERLTRRRAISAAMAAGAIVFSARGVRAFQREPSRPGSIELDNGLIFSGQCTTASTLAPIRLDQAEVDRPDQGLLLRMVDQGARQIYVNHRQCKEPVFDNAVWPSLTFKVPQTRQRRKPMPQGFPVLGGFDESGVARGKILGLPKGPVDIEAAITEMNELFVEVTSMTHDWRYALATNSLPPNILLGVIRKVEGYDTQSVRRLELVRMLIRADRLPEAGILLQSIAVDFPDVAAEQAQFQASLREQLARQITDVLEQRRDAGQHQLASNGARLHAREDLTPESIVRVTRLVNDYDSLNQRIGAVKASLTTLAAEINDPSLRDSVMMINRLVLTQINADTIDRFAAFELVAPVADAAAPVGAANANQPSDQELLALAYSGWLMGADQSIRNLTDTISLFDARQLILDYLDTDLGDTDLRRELADRIRRMEGVGVDRVAAIVRHLPAVRSVHISAPEEPGRAGAFEMSSADNLAGCIGLVPPEYHEGRSYPMVIAFPPEFGTREDYLSLWRSSCEKHGYIVVVPFWHKSPDEVEDIRFDAASGQHMEFLSLMKELKRGLRIDDERVFVAGHSEGGEIAMDVAASHADLFAGVVSVCGMARRHLLFTVGNTIDVPWYVVVGDSQAGWYERLGQLSAKLFKRDPDAERYFDTLFIKHPFRGVSLYPEELDDMFAWMKRHRRVTYPPKFTAQLLRNSDLHWSWVRVDSLPPKYAQLDTPTNGSESRYTPAELTVRMNDRNQILIASAPSGVTVFLSPKSPGLDLTKSIRISFGRKREVVDYSPEIVHLLEELYDTGDRSRLCYMRVHIDK